MSMPATPSNLSPDAVDLTVEFAGLRLRNPLMPASGTFGYGQDMAKFMDLRRMGALVGKTITPQPRKGNLAPRMAETAAGMLNCIGLENPGIDDFCKNGAPAMRQLHDVVIVNIAGDTPEAFARMAAQVAATGKASALELNLSCPNVAHGLDFGKDPAAIEKISRLVKAASPLPVFAKLTPNTDDITVLAAAAEQGGADGVTLINTLIGMAVDWRKRRPVLSINTGGLSGPAIKSVALAMVYRAANRVKIPILGVGGIATADDVLEFMVAGASAVQVGTATFVQPDTLAILERELRESCARHGVARIRDLVRTIRPWS